MNFETALTEIFESLDIRPKTKVNYVYNYRRNIAPIIGNLQIEQVDRKTVLRILSQLPPQTAATSLAILKTVYRECIKNGQIEASPVSNIDKPRIQIKARKFLTTKELAEIEFKKYETQIFFLALHGLRWGEAVALTNQDIINGKIHITKSIHGPTKSSAGNRVVPQMSPFEPFPKTPKGIRRELSPYGVTIHSLRHTYAYLLKESGVHVTTAQKLMGHSDPKITLGIYTQFREAEIDEAAVLMRKKMNH
jgi:integrase